MAARANTTFKNRHEYIPPSVQQSMAQHMERSLPPNLKKYQEAGSYIPAHEERALSQHMQKNLPSHLKQYGDAYVQQNIVQPSIARPGSSESLSSNTPSSASPVGPRLNQNFSGSTFQPSQPSSGNAQPPNKPGGEYDFILDPQKPPRSPLPFSTGGKFQKILIIGGGIIILIVLAVVANSLLSGSANAQNNKLLTLAKTQTEIIRIIDEADDKVTDQELRNLSINTKLSVASTKQQTISSPASRGKEVKTRT